MPYKFSQKFPKKRAFITGAGSGLGRAFCLELATEGWTIGISDIMEKGLDETRKMIEEKGGKTLSYVFDVANKEQYSAASSDFLEKTGGIDLLINNAGVGDGDPFEDYSLENWEWIVGINQMGVIYGCYYFIPAMKKQGGGHIINISSAAAFACPPNMSSYNVTKAANTALAESLYPELKGFGVGISVVMSTFFKTNIMQHARGGQRSKVMAEKLISRSGIEPSVVANVVLTKAGKGNFYIVYPFQSWFFYTLKRLFPTFLMKVNAKAYKNKDRLAKHL